MQVGIPSKSNQKRPCPRTPTSGAVALKICLADHFQVNTANKRMLWDKVKIPKSIDVNMKCSQGMGKGFKCGTGT